MARRNLRSVQITDWQFLHYWLRKKELNYGVILTQLFRTISMLSSRKKKKLGLKWFVVSTFYGTCPARSQCFDINLIADRWRCIEIAHRSLLFFQINTHLILRRVLPNTRVNPKLSVIKSSLLIVHQFVSSHYFRNRHSITTFGRIIHEKV